MFNRRCSQKPSTDLIANFKKSFQNLAAYKHDSLLDTPESAQPLDLDMSFDPRHYENPAEQQEDSTSPRGNNSQTPSSQSGINALHYNTFFDFQSPASWQQTPNIPNYYTSQSQYGWPSNMQQGLPTPFSRSLSLPSPGQSHHPAFLSLQDVQLQPSFNASPFDFQNVQAFSPHGVTTPFNPYGHTSHAPSMLPSQQHMPMPNYQTLETDSQFRFQVSLLNSTAMVKQNDVPVSYLNKRQTYKIAIQDTRPEPNTGVPTTYRTFVRVSFHEEKQRAHPDQHWQLWKEGRGMNEAQQHGGRLQAIEYVSQPGAPGQHPNLHFEKDSIDGFCITWSVAPGHRPMCEVQFRCNFLSTDFSRSKGVKGIPVRLCAKNEVVGFPSTTSSSLAEPEVSYCKIKLFRDHGAERKLTNDEAAVKRAIKKAEDQMSETPGDGDDEPVPMISSSGKRKAGDFSPSTRRPAKVARYKRATSVSSEGSSQGQVGGDGDVAQKLINLNRLLRSRLDVTWFALRGDETDDPDLRPVELTDSTTRPASESSPEVKRLQRSGTGLTESSAASLGEKNDPVSPPQRRKQYLQVPTPVTSQHNSADWSPAMKKESSADSSILNVQQLASPEEPVTSTRINLGQAGSIQALDVDDTYRPVPAPVVKPVACFYVKLVFENTSPNGNLHRACYLYERTADALISTIARKANITPRDVVKVAYMKNSGSWQIQVGVDDDLVLHLPEGQDMLAEFTVVSADAATGKQHEHSAGPPQYNLTIHPRI